MKLKTLSEKITHLDYDEPHIQVKDVREFIRLESELFWLYQSGKISLREFIKKKTKLVGPELTQTQHKGDYARGINKIMHKDTQTQDEKTCANKGAKD